MADTIEGLADNISQSSPNEFSTSVHVADKDGPKNNKDGSFKKKRGSTTRSRVEIPDEPIASAPAYKEMGMVMAATVTSSFTMLFGSEWRPEQQEADAMADAWAAYFEATGMSNFPPWVMLAMVHTGYIGKRLVMPETQSRFQRIRYRFYVWRFRRKTGMTPEEYARANSRDDLQRENDPSNQS